MHVLPLLLTLGTGCLEVYLSPIKEEDSADTAVESNADSDADADAGAGGVHPEPGEPCGTGRGGDSFGRRWTGTGHVVLDGVLYYNEDGSRTLVAHDLGAGAELTRQDLPGAGFENTYQYSYGAHTDIDFAVDDGKLYVIYSTAAAAGKIDYNPADGLIYVTRGGVLGTIQPTWN